MGLSQGTPKGVRQLAVCQIRMTNKGLLLNWMSAWPQILVISKADCEASPLRSDKVQLCRVTFTFLRLSAGVAVLPKAQAVLLYRCEMHAIVQQCVGFIMLLDCYDTLLSGKDLLRLQRQFAKKELTRRCLLFWRTPALFLLSRCRSAEKSLST